MQRMKRTCNLLSEEEREIDKIQQEIKIINEMFRDMDEIVNYQGLSLTTIEDNLGNIIIDVKRAETEIQTTEINMKNRFIKLGVVVGVITGTATGVGIPLLLMLGVKAVVIGASIGSISGAIIGKVS